MKWDTSKLVIEKLWRSGAAKYTCEVKVGMIVRNAKDNRITLTIVLEIKSRNQH